MRTRRPRPRQDPKVFQITRPSIKAITISATLAASRYAGHRLFTFQAITEPQMKLAAQNTTGLVAREAEEAWQGWSAGSEQTDEPRYKTFFGGGGQPTSGLVQGILEYPPGARSRLHRHTPAETYYVLAGTGVGRIGDATLPIGPGDAIFVPSGAVHAFENTGPDALRVLWTLNCDHVDDIDFHYLD